MTGTKLLEYLPDDLFDGAVVFLSSPLAAYVTGTLLVVDGGQNLAGSCPFGELLDQALKT